MLLIAVKMAPEEPDAKGDEREHERNERRRASIRPRRDHVRVIYTRSIQNRPDFLSGAVPSILQNTRPDIESLGTRLDTHMSDHESDSQGALPNTDWTVATVCPSKVLSDVLGA